MWDGLFMLLSLSAIMAAASFFAGSLPLSFSLSPRQLRFISALGTGVLVGTSLIVIIPEGVETLYGSSSSEPHSHVKRSMIARAPVETVHQPTWTIPWTFHENTIVPHHIDTLENSNNPVLDLRAEDNTDKNHQEDAHSHPTESSPSKEHDHEHSRSPHAYVGISLILGFILMYLIDVIPSLNPPPSSAPLHISLSNLSQGLHRASSTSPPSSPFASSSPQAPVPSNPHAKTTTVGLVIHSLADGIALGASSTTAASNLSFIIFLAIMLHKAPAAFGLTSVLLKQGLPKRAARAHLLVFSVAAPAGALATWAVVHALGREIMGGEEGTGFATGVVLLFSGGTFLYVAMHSVQEANSHDHEMEAGYQEIDTYGGQSRAPKQKSKSGAEVGVMVAGMLLPLLTQVGHAH
ncbi:Zinc/iron permease [Patellaria atrata CBS 101060]|uniref:Zinc/iron permease n=1 Tax=Patellaria atrata CBS 101060 TaxID=1346257 RepID=A0A9P4S6A7_9PEZI|nr:Zinc/iron permease [Patellaria atrata CBS 101060]